MSYRPLPEYLTIAPSSIEGKGLVTFKDISANYILGITHIKDERFEDGYIRTPLGGFFNHSDEPNCEAYIEGDFIKLRTLRKIKQGEEITAKYWLYDLNKNEDNKK
jgi:SET domain-containing protein